MSAIVIDLKDFAVRTPEQAVRIFCELYNPEKVEVQLWSIFRLYTQKNENETIVLDPDEPDTALLFDHLIALSAAIHQLRLHTEGRCVICGRSPGSDDG